MKRKLDIYFILIRVIDNNLIETSSLFKLLVVNFASKKIKKLLLIKYSLKPISSFKFITIAYIIRENNFPSAINITVDTDLCNSIQGLLGNSTIENHWVCIWNVKKQSSFSSLWNPRSIIVFENFKPILFIVLLYILLFNISSNCLIGIKILHFT